MIDKVWYIETPIILTSTLSVGKAADGLISYTIKKCQEENTEALSINPIIGECNDFMLNDVQDRCIGEEEVINDAKADFLEGGVGAGTGMVCCGIKGGIGSSSRLTLIDGKYYTIGILVQSNFGGITDLIIDGTKVGEKLKDFLFSN